MPVVSLTLESPCVSFYCYLYCKWKNRYIFTLIVLSYLVALFFAFLYFFFFKSPTLIHCLHAHLFVLIFRPYCSIPDTQRTVNRQVLRNGSATVLWHMSRAQELISSDTCVCHSIRIWNESVILSRSQPTPSPNFILFCWWCFYFNENK